MLKCVIVDDEEFSIASLVKYIALIPNLSISAIYHNPQMALENFTTEQKIDLVFMDINMPLISGLELAVALRGKFNKLIFTTSHAEHALEAYNAEGDAYLLKPYSFVKFYATVSRLFPKNLADSPAGESRTGDYFLVKNKDENLRITRVYYRDIIAVESAMNYVKIFLAGNRSLTAYLTLKDMTVFLAERKQFVQFHRAFIISTDSINYIEGNSIKLVNNISFSVGERYKDRFTAFLAQNLLKTSRKP